MKASSHPFRSERAKTEYEDLYLKRAMAWPVDSEVDRIETPSGSTFVRLSGRQTDPPLVLLPGSRGTSLTWIPEIAALSDHFHTYALDSIYDHGLSVRRKKLKKTADLITWLNEVLEAISPSDPVNLLGLSYGGWLASQYAQRYPQRVNKVVLLDPAATILPVSLAMIFRALISVIPFPGTHAQFYNWLLRDTVESGESGKAYVDEAVADWETAERCFAPLPLINATVISDRALQEFPVPCLVMIGENEKVYSASRAARRLKRVAPQIQVEIIPRAGHDAWVVQAKMVTERTVEFLDRGTHVEARSGINPSLY